MGMAASQARYLGLAARKTNCEYQGQQINQARTALGNQSAELWNQMLGLSVPTVPNQEDYVSTQYSFSDGQNNFEITDMVPTDEEEGYNYAVKYRYFEKEIKGIENTNTNPQVKVDVKKLTGQTIKAEAGGAFSYNGNVFSEITDAKELDKARSQLKLAGATVADDAKIWKTANGDYYIGNIAASTDATIYNGNLSGYKLGNTSASVADKTDPNTDATLKKIAEDNPNTKIAEAINAGKDVYTFVKNGTTYYCTEEELQDCIKSTQNNSGEISQLDKQDPLKQYYTSQVDSEVVRSSYALMDDASGTGRFSSIKLKDYNTSFNLNTETKTNEEAYNQAMNQYYYETQQYEKTNADINAKTSIIQQQDRTLELRLKQLDTEHNALQTEMEAVKKVMDKNVEDTFKTFNG